MTPLPPDLAAPAATARPRSPTCCPAPPPRSASRSSATACPPTRSASPRPSAAPAAWPSCSSTASAPTCCAPTPTSRPPSPALRRPGRRPVRALPQHHPGQPGHPRHRPAAGQPRHPRLRHRRPGGGPAPSTTSSGRDDPDPDVWQARRTVFEQAAAAGVAGHRRRPVRLRRLGPDPGGLPRRRLPGVGQPRRPRAPRCWQSLAADAARPRLRLPPRARPHRPRARASTPPPGAPSSHSSTASSSSSSTACPTTPRSWSPPTTACSTSRPTTRFDLDRQPDLDRRRPRCSPGSRGPATCTPSPAPRPTSCDRWRERARRPGLGGLPGRGRRQRRLRPGGRRPGRPHRRRRRPRPRHAGRSPRPSGSPARAGSPPTTARSPRPSWRSRCSPPAAAPSADGSYSSDDRARSGECARVGGAGRSGARPAPTGGSRPSATTVAVGPGQGHRPALDLRAGPRQLVAPRRPAGRRRRAAPAPPRAWCWAACPGAGTPGPAAQPRQRHLPAAVRGDQVRAVPGHLPVVEAVRQHEHVRGEPVAAQVAALPHVRRPGRGQRPGRAAGRAARSRRRARRACRRGRSAAAAGSPTEPSQGAVEQVGVGRAHRPPQALAAGPAVGVGPPATRTRPAGRPDAGPAAAARSPPGPGGPAAGATAASKRDSASASRPHGPGCSISSQRWAGGGRGDGGVAPGQRLHRAAAVVQPARRPEPPDGGAILGSAELRPHARVVRAVRRVPTAAVVPAGHRWRPHSVTSRRARVSRSAGVQARQVADLQLPGRQQRGQRRPHLGGEGVGAPAGDQRRPGRRRRPAARSAAGGAGGAPCRG